jgi:hypothetical protein
MKRDCPHCHKSMGGRFLRWSKIANVDRNRNCPLCGGDIEYRLYPEELGARAFTIVAAIGAAYWAKERGGGYLAILIGFAATLAVVYVAVSFRLRDQQRFKKGADWSAAGKP